MNTFLTHLVRRDHSLQLAAHLAAGILSLILLSGFARPDPAADRTASIEVRTPAPALVVASAVSR